MKCPFCAEEIQDAAIVCRFCGARRNGETWSPPPLPSSSVRRVHRKGASTIKSAAICFLLSAAWSLYTITSAVPLAGAMRGGAVAIAYNLLYVILFTGMGVGLLTGKMWGYNFVLVSTALYTIDKALFILDKSSRDAYLVASGITKEVASLIDTSMFDSIIVLVTVTLMACWWGFAIYLYWRRDYFEPVAKNH